MGLNEFRFERTEHIRDYQSSPILDSKNEEIGNTWKLYERFNRNEAYAQQADFQGNHQKNS